jgi:4-alpha-glucanotransferase
MSSLPAGKTCTSKRLIFSDGDLRVNSNWRGTGVAIPVFSIRSGKGLGVGEFPDLKLVVDWAVKCQMNLIQILPINDTTVFKDYRDSYPYRFVCFLNVACQLTYNRCSSVSVFALHPLYLRLDEVTNNKEILKEIEEKKAVLNKLKEIDYEVTKNSPF